MSFPQPELASQGTMPVHSRQRRVGKKVEPFFFNPRLKLAAVRLGIFCSAVGVGTVATTMDLHDNGVYLGIMAFVLVHQIISVFKIRFFVRLLDLILAMAEVSLLIIMHAPFTKDLGRMTPTSLLVTFAAAWGLIAVTVYLLLCRFAAIIRHRGKNLLKGFDLLEDAQRIKGIPIANCPAAYSMLIGRSIWRLQFVGEGLPVRLLRGFFAGVLIAALISYAVIALLVKPLKETAFIPTRESRGTSIDSNEEVEPQEWNFAFSRRMYQQMADTPGLNSSDTFYSAIKVTPQWDNSDADQPECIRQPDIQILDKPLQIIHVKCPGRVNGTFRTDWMPDVLIEVDYEPLQISPDQFISLFEGVIGISAGFTNNPEYLTRKTQSTPLPPAAHYLAPVSIEIRKALKHPLLSALGMFESKNTFWVPRIGSIVPDPAATLDPPVFNMSRTSSTFRIFFHLDVTEVRVLEEDREQSILGGFSAIGGLWTFLGGIFALFFGTSLMKIFFGSKALSIFGLAQQIEKDKIAKAYLQEYPRIRQELSLPRSQRGIMTLLQDHMIDVELFRDAIDDEATQKDVLMTKYDVEELSSSAIIPHHVQQIGH